VLAAAAAAATVWIAMGTAASAAIKTKEVEYRQGDTTLQGFLAWDGAAKGKRPGILVVHEWWGHNEHARNQARRLARAGYVAFALDMYGKGKVATHPGDAEAFMKEATKDPAVLTARFDAALARLKQETRVDPERVAAIGYCFGGSVVLGMARAGADLAAVVSFHGALATATPAQAGKVKARVLVLTGADDPMIPPEQVLAFEEEMREASARFEVVSYPGARHSFTNPEAHRAGMEALAYDAQADEKSWARMLELFGEVFPKRAR
jgi:dienelactone hydrolase